MMKNSFNLYISENYDKLYKRSLYITKDENTASDLLNIVLLNILENINNNNISEKLYNCNNFYNYINRCLILQYNSSTSYYFKLYPIYSVIDDIGDFDDDLDFGMYELLDEIIKYVNETNFYQDEIDRVLKSGLSDVDKGRKLNYLRLKDDTNKRLFFDYYLSTGKNSFRSIAEKYGISKTKVINSCYFIMDSIKIKFKNYI